jgi:hypothetical protein
MKAEDLVRKFDLDYVLDYVRTLEITQETMFLRSKIRLYSDNYRRALRERDDIEECLTRCSIRYECSKWYNKWFFSIMKNKYFNLLVEINGVLKLYEETIINTVKDLEFLLETQDKK